jgi:hypothetical protein
MGSRSKKRSDELGDFVNLPGGEGRERWAGNGGFIRTGFLWTFTGITPGLKFTSSPSSWGMQFHLVNAMMEGTSGAKPIGSTV